MHSGILIGILVVLALLAAIVLCYPLMTRKSILILPIVLVFSLIGGAYIYWGGISLYRAHEQKIESQQRAKELLRSIKSPQALITQLRNKLDDTPRSAKGWYLLGRLYLSQQDEQQAFAAFAKAHHFAPDNEQYTVHYAHSLWQLNHRQFNPQLIKIFTELVQRNPQQPDALAMLAMNAYLNHEYKKAIGYWQRLLEQLPIQSKEAQALQKAIAKAQKQMH